jgi:hypothetical protein
MKRLLACMTESKESLSGSSLSLLRQLDIYQLSSLATIIRTKLHSAPNNEIHGQSFARTGVSTWRER